LAVCRVISTRQVSKARPVTSVRNVTEALGD
jgi:hypothetical protein